MQFFFNSPELATEIVTVAGDVGVHEGGRGEDHRRHPDEQQHQRGGLENKTVLNDRRTTMSSSRADPVLELNILSNCPGLGYLNI